MISAQKQQKRSTKFNYLAANNVKQQLLGRYETLNFSPSYCKRSYQCSSQQKNKENIKQNVVQDFIDESKFINKNTSIDVDKLGKSLNERLVSFRKNYPESGIHSYFREKQNKIIRNQENINNERKRESQAFSQTRNKSFGNISFKKPQLEKSQYLSKTIKGIQFSPYQEQRKQAKDMEISPSERQRLFDGGIRQQSSYYPQPQQKLLIHELEEQQSIIKRQLKQYELQNDLLREKIDYLQKENIHLKEQVEKYSHQLQSQEVYFQQLFDSQSTNISQLQRQIQTLNIKNQHYETVLSEDKLLIADLQNQIQQFNFRSHQFQITLQSKQRLIKQLSTKIQLLSVQNQIPYDTNQLTKRRKSLDLSIQTRTPPFYDASVNYSTNAQNYFSAQYAQNDDQRQRTFSIGKVMNRKSSPRLHPIDDPKVIEKQQNFIESIKSMYFKINNKETRDLKQLWKWLKSIAHEYQAFSQFYYLKDSLLALLDELQNRQSQSPSKTPSSFIEQESYSMIKRLAEFITKSQK